MHKYRKFWNKAAKNYDTQVNKKYAKTNRDTIELSRKYLNSNQTVLDFACGTGIITIELAKNVKKMYAIDISEKMIEIARKKMINNRIDNLEFEVSNIFDPKLNGMEVNVLLAFNILYFLEDIDRALNRISELLPSGGLFISATDCLGERKSLKENLLSFFLSKLGTIPLIKKYKTLELKNIIKSHGFKIVETKNLYHNPPNYFIVAKKQ
ncbi:MAG: class I SAM-dependent DNA methyltransferase [Atribacterota bacterium]